MPTAAAPTAAAAAAAAAEEVDDDDVTSALATSQRPPPPAPGPPPRGLGRGHAAQQRLRVAPIARVTHPGAGADANACRSQSAKTNRPASQWCQQRDAAQHAAQRAEERGSRERWRLRASLYRRAAPPIAM